ncbi:MAG TPA: hypothetical protein DCQ83_05715 [Fibrobacteres bacterium]|nr:hypothetical protein [Fibrobacterota bacterium]
MYTSGVNLKRHLLKCSAILALMAWANVQVMACCWSFAPSKATVAEVSSEHACCHKKTASAMMPVGDAPALHVGHSAKCGMQDGIPAVQSSAPSGDLALAVSEHAIPEQTVLFSKFFSAAPVRNTGPPVFLEFQRLLI